MDLWSREKGNSTQLLEVKREQNRPVISALEANSTIKSEGSQSIFLNWLKTNTLKMAKIVLLDGLNNFRL